jgi:predicted AAA+ superfamily ATPase
MVIRRFWLDRLNQAWQRRSVLWLTGVRRTGKTFLSRCIPQAEYFDCELPSVRRQFTDPESFLRERRDRTVVLDEIHRLDNPSEILKIAADHFPDVRVLATGSSTLGASKRFRDTLTGRKEEVLLTPMTSADLSDFGGGGLEHRLRNGGLPPMYLSESFPERECQEWIDCYWAKDVQELFRLERRRSFERFIELLFVQSGGMFEATSFSKPCEVSRPTIQNYLAVLEATFVATVVRPYHSSRVAEIVAAPKVYGFDTGFVCAFRGWRDLRSDDHGPLWEHYVLNELRSRFPAERLRYWRDKQQHEIDFILEPHPNAPPAVVECKWSADAFDPANLRIFRRHYPQGVNFVVAHDVVDGYTRRLGSLAVRFIGIEALAEELGGRGTLIPEASS